MHKAIKAACALTALCLAAGAGFLSGIRIGAKTETPAASAIVATCTDTIESFRKERQQLRQMQLSQLNEITHSESSDSGIIALAQQRQLELMNWSEQELTLEGILALRGFEDAVVTVHTDSVNVMVRGEGITAQEASVILELACRETGISGGNIKIIPVN